MSSVLVGQDSTPVAVDKDFSMDNAIVGEIVEFLEGLGDTPRKVAQAVVNEGIELKCGLVGRGRAKHCPIAELLGKQFPGLSFYVAPAMMVVLSDWAQAKITVPRPVSDFILRFDKLDVANSARFNGEITPERIGD